MEWYVRNPLFHQNNYSHWAKASRSLKKLHIYIAKDWLHYEGNLKTSWHQFSKLLKFIRDPYLLGPSLENRYKCEYLMNNSHHLISEDGTIA